MNWMLLALLITILLATFWGGRRVYLRSMRLRERLRMSRVYTNITHELLTPLTVISASIDMMRDEEPRFNSDYDLMQLNIQRMVRLIQQILETSKSQSGQLRLLVSQGDVMKYITDTARCVEPLIAKKHMRFDMSCQPETMMGWIDTDKIDKIIYNLLSNAAKYSREDGVVTLRVRTNTNFDRIRIEVSDTGQGISAAKMKRLFSRFQDGDYRQNQTIGTGLGLALTQDLVYLHGGTIDCKSVEGQGTTFIVELPISKESFLPDQIDEQHTIDFNLPKNAISDFRTAIPDANSDVEDEDGNDGTKRRLLIVEDNIELLMLMKQVLKSQYQVFVANNGKRALSVIGQHRIDLIISDVMMPEMDGLELTQAIKQDPEYNHLPVILLTAKTQETDEAEALRAGADEYLTKPFRLSDLKLRIENIIENRQRIQEGQQLPEEQQKREPTPEELFLSRATKCVFDHLDDDSYDRDAMAADMGASASTLYNKLRAVTGMNVSTFIRDIRMKEAQRIARENPTIRVSDLAYRVGFRDPRYFSTCFKKHFGLQPTEFMEQVNTNTDKQVSHA